MASNRLFWNFKTSEIIFSSCKLQRNFSAKSSRRSAVPDKSQRTKYDVHGRCLGFPEGAPGRASSCHRELQGETFEGYKEPSGLMTRSGSISSPLGAASMPHCSIQKQSSRCRNGAERVSSLYFCHGWSELMSKFRSGLTACYKASRSLCCARLLAV